MQNVMIVGGGKGGSAIIKMMEETDVLDIKAVVDINDNAPGLKLARELGIPTGTDWRDFLDSGIDIIVEATGEDKVFETLREKRSKETVLIPGSVAYIIATLMEEKEELIGELKNKSYIQDLILNSTHDGMVGIDKQENVILFNKSAEYLTGFSRQDVIGRKLGEVYPKNELTRVLDSRKVEVNREQVLDNGRKIITTRIPMLTDDMELLGAFEVFKDITEVVNLAEEITNLKDIQTMLKAIIQSSEEAISVVDETGCGIVINPAYTRITGLSEEEVIGKPATADISEGESMHMKVLKTRKPVRGVRMKVGPANRDVLVNVAPVIVDGKLKGSVGVIHDVSEISSLTNELKRARQIIRTLEAKYSFDDIIGDSVEIKVAIEQAELAAGTPATVLLRGESGTGKELFAHAIHNGSSRKYNKFIRVNCAALPENLLESELFGYEEGAFSGAKRGGKRGLFEEANNGSIFLDEIGEMTLNTQAKLLRVLQESEIVKVGGTKAIPVNVRVIAATNLDLEKAIVGGQFRQDLYYRLNRIPIPIPPLRSRKNDIPLLVPHLIRKINQDYGRNVETISAEALSYLQKYDWPGNVRELENILGRAMIYMKLNEAVMELHHLPELPAASDRVEMHSQPGQLGYSPELSLGEMEARFEKEIIKKALDDNNGNKTAAARQLSVSLRSLYYKMEKHHLANYGVQ